MSQTEKKQFQTESKQILDLMIHSIYSNKDIFLRELISNSSDALDKLRIEALTNQAILTEGEKFEIRIEADKEKRTLTISDNGIGMSREEVVNNIGTIARSGTKELIQKMKDTRDNELLAGMIGQFGVGFYSVFMVAEKVTLITRKAGEKDATRWESSGDGEYTLADTEKESHGTTIIIELKPADEEASMLDYTKDWVLTEIIKKYSDFINYPIILKTEREEIERDKDGKPVENGKRETVVEDRVVNSMKPIWTKNSSEVKEEEYQEFYKHISHDWNPPLKTVNYKAEGNIEFTSLLYIPSKAPFDFYYQGFKSGLQLYVKRVMIMESFEELLPHYLRFVKGVVESSDLPLNISREMLQKDRQIMLMKKNITKKVIDTLKDLSEKENEKYLGFYQEFGPAIKEGVTSDFENKEKLIPLLYFQSSADPEKLTNLKDYISRMKSEQEEIYYITGENRKLLENSPQLEALKEKGYEVLFMTDPVDEIVVNSVTEYDSKKLKSVTKGKIELGNKEEREKAEKELKDKEKEFDSLIHYLKDRLSEQIKEVRLSNRLLNAPACIVTDENDISPSLEKLLKRTNMGAPKAKRILELNPAHPIVAKMHERFEKDNNDQSLSEYGELLMGYAMLSEGWELPDPLRFNSLVLKLMEKNL